MDEKHVTLLSMDENSLSMSIRMNYPRKIKSQKSYVS
jgi:hypothetical protein